MSTKNRIMEIDFIRGIAIILMILFHLIVDLKDFYNYDVEYLIGFWYIEGKFAAILFILLCGISSTLSKNNTHHGITVFLWAMLLTVVTYFYNKNCFIIFGILHFLSISLLSANIMKPLPLTWLSFISGSSIILGTLFSQRFIDNPDLWIIGLVNSTFISLDYYPLFPWYGVFVLGIIIGKILYGNKKRPSNRQASPAPTKPLVHLLLVKIPKIITKLGQYSLIIYLIHQPILLILLYMIHSAIT